MTEGLYEFHLII